jgi:hypothetical protein
LRKVTAPAAIFKKSFPITLTTQQQQKNKLVPFCGTLEKVNLLSLWQNFRILYNKI